VRARVIIVGGGPVVSKALQAILGSAGYCAQFLRESALEEVGLDESLAESHLLIIAPDLSAERLQSLLGIVGPASSVKIPVLQLVPVNGEQRRLAESIVHWPCPMEELRRAIETALGLG
jgi:hypothetical protein